MKVAVLQMVSTPDVQENLASAEALVTEAAAQGAELLVLPEYFCGMGMQDKDKLAWAEARGDGPIQAALSRWAKTHGVWLAGAPSRFKRTLRIAYTTPACCSAPKVHARRSTTRSTCFASARRKNITMNPWSLRQARSLWWHRCRTAADTPGLWD